MRKDNFKYKVDTSRGIKSKFQCDIFLTKEKAIEEAQLAQSLVDYKIRRRLNGYTD